MQEIQENCVEIFDLSFNVPAAYEKRNTKYEKSIYMMITYCDILSNDVDLCVGLSILAAFWLSCSLGLFSDLTCLWFMSIFTGHPYPTAICPEEKGPKKNQGGC